MIHDEWMYDAYVKQKTDFYLPKWKSMEESGSIISWNWPAFLFSGLWMAYRRMYLESIIYFTIVTFGSMLLGETFTLVSSIAIGILGNHIYMRKATRKISNLKHSSDSTRNALKNVGGTSVAGVFIIFIIYALIAVAFEALLLSAVSY